RSKRDGISASPRREPRVSGAVLEAVPLALGSRRGLAVFSAPLGCFQRGGPSLMMEGEEPVIAPPRIDRNAHHRRLSGLRDALPPQPEPARPVDALPAADLPHGLHRRGGPARGAPAPAAARTAAAGPHADVRLRRRPRADPALRSRHAPEAGPSPTAAA